MATLVLTDAKVWLNGYDFSGDSNAVALDYSAELKDATTFSHTTKGNRPGLKMVNFNLQGFWNGTVQDPQSYALIGASSSPIIVSHAGGTEGDRAFLFDANFAKYAPGAQVGEMFGFSLEAQSNVNGDLARGILELNSVKTVNGNSAGTQQGAVSASQKLYAAVQVLAFSGGSPTLDVDVESDDNAGFSSAVTQMSFTQFTGIGAQVISKAGAIADDYFRLAFTIGGAGPSFTIVGAIGIA